MGGLIILRKPPSHPPPRVEVLAAMQRRFAQAGFGAPIRLEGGSYQLHYYPKILDPRPSIATRPDGDFLVCAGTILLGSRTGAEALAALLAAPDRAAAIARCRGHFILVEGNPHVIRILRDPCGALELFHDSQDTIFSTNLLALAATLPRRVLRRQEALEYVFHGNPLGDGTVLEGVHKLSTGDTVRIAETVTRVHRRPALPAEDAGERQALAQGALDGLADMLRDAGQAFAGRAALALSGGYDTRLLLALCQRCGIAPHLFVYGTPASSDVVLAKGIAEGQHLAIEHLDKDGFPDLPQDVYAEVVRRNYIHADGLIYYGIFDNNAEIAACRSRHAEGVLNLHGGAGEVFRNFFGLSARRISARGIAQLFYVADARICAAPFSDEAYVRHIERKMLATLGLEEGEVSRQAAEALYPYFRCHSWYGKDLSVNARFGHTLMPFYEAGNVTRALGLPMAMKFMGNFEALMIRSLDPVLAAYPTSYGYGFEADAPRLPSLKQWLLQQRPAWFRRAAAQARKTPSTARMTVWHEERAGDLLDLDQPVMRELIRPEAARHSDVYPRICNLAYFVREQGISDLVE